MGNSSPVNCRLLLALFSCVWCLMLLPEAKAELKTFQLDASQSSLTVFGHLYGEVYQAQGVGALTTSFGGTIEVDVTTNSIQFVAGSAVDAMVSGNWTPQSGSPNGTGPADFGGFTDDIQSGQDVNFFLATRDLVFDLTSGVLPIAEGSFSADGTNLTISQGHTDWTMVLKVNQQSQLHGASQLVGEGGVFSGGVGTLVSAGGVQTLTLPVHVSIPIDGDGNGSIDTEFGLSGTLVATAELPTIAGDFNGDGNVDGADFVIWQTNFPNNSGTATLDTGDANGDGNVDGADFVVWQTNFPTTASSIATVPEPSAALLMFAAVGTAIAVRRRFKS